MLHNIRQSVQFSFIDKALNEFGIDHADAAALTVDNILLFNNDRLNIVVSKGRRSSTAGVSCSDNNYFRSYGLHRIRSSMVVWICEETRLFSRVFGV